jgi:hypothetical protein
MWEGFLGKKPCFLEAGGYNNIEHRQRMNATLGDYGQAKQALKLASRRRYR